LIKSKFQLQKKEKGILLSDEDTPTRNADKERSEKPESVAPLFFMNPYDWISWHLHQQRDIVSRYHPGS